MSTHTPGPWEWRDSFDLVHGETEVLTIGEGYDGLWGGKPPSDADARVVAAAPELLDAVWHALGTLDAIADNWGDASEGGLRRFIADKLPKLRAAAAKAEGR